MINATLFSQLLPNLKNSFLNITLDSETNPSLNSNNV